LEKTDFNENPSSKVSSLEDEDMMCENSKPRVNAFSPSINFLNFDFDSRDNDILDYSVNSLFLGV